MKQSLTSRVSRLISGSMNAIVDTVENSMPEAVMEEAIREVDSAIDEVRVELGKVEANKYLANARLTEEKQKHASLTEQIEVALKESRDDLAEVAIARQLDIEAQLPVLETSINEATKKEKELEGYILALQARKREMRNELNQFRESRKAGEQSVSAPEDSSANKSGVENKVERATDAFDRVMGTTSGLPSGGQPSGKDDAAKLAELDKLARDNRVKERLAAMKNATGKE